VSGTTTDQPAATMLEVPARRIPPPASVSPEARAALSESWAAGDVAYPPPDDLESWALVRQLADQAIVDRIAAQSAAIAASVETVELAGVTVHVLTPADLAADATNRVYLDIHGGALVFGAGDACRAMGLIAMDRAGVRTCAVDYRVPPEHPYPAALDDCIAVYRALLAEHAPGDVIVGGASAGGNLAAALLLRAHDEALPMPAAAVLLTPELDLTESGDTFQTNLGVDTVLTGSLADLNLLYAGGHDLAHPYLSPLFGDVAAFPPTFLQAGTRDLFLSNTVRMHRKLRAAGVEAELHVFEAMPHGGFGDAPEDRVVGDEMRRFVTAHGSSAG